VRLSELAALTTTKECDDRTTRVRNVRLRNADGEQKRMVGELENARASTTKEKDEDDNDDEGNKKSEHGRGLPLRSRHVSHHVSLQSTCFA
jgi:hypothetical protein